MLAVRGSKSTLPPCLLIKLLTFRLFSILFIFLHRFQTGGRGTTRRYRGDANLSSTPARRTLGLTRLLPTRPREAISLRWVSPRRLGGGFSLLSLLLLFLLFSLLALVMSLWSHKERATNTTVSYLGAQIQPIREDKRRPKGAAARRR